MFEIDTLCYHSKLREEKCRDKICFHRADTVHLCLEPLHCDRSDRLCNYRIFDRMCGWHSCYPLHTAFMYSVFLPSFEYFDSGH